MTVRSLLPPAVPDLAAAPCGARPGSCIARLMETLLRARGLRPTRQRAALAALIYGQGHRHLTAEALHAEALAAGVDVSLATVYNTLRQFSDEGFLRQIPVDGAKIFFDTNVSDHQHFLVEETGEIIDIAGPVDITQTPELPPGMEVLRRDVIIRLRRKKARH